MATNILNIDYFVEKGNMEGIVKVEENIFDENCEVLEERISEILDECFMISMIRQSGEYYFDITEEEIEYYEVDEDAVRLIKQFIEENFEDYDNLGFLLHFNFDDVCWLEIMILSKETIANGNGIG